MSLRNMVYIVIYVEINQSYYQTVTLRFASWTVHGTKSNLANQRKNVLTSCIEHQQDSMKRDWNSLGATEQTKHCSSLSYMSGKGLWITRHK